MESDKIAQHKSKKQVFAQTFLKGMITDDKDQIKDLIRRSTVIEMKDQAKYDDDTESLTIKIHYKPKAG